MFVLDLVSAIFCQNTKYQLFNNSEKSYYTTVYPKIFIEKNSNFIPLSGIANVNTIYLFYNINIYNENEYLRQIRFTNIPQSCQIKIYTITGEFVQVIDHYDLEDGNAVWDLRTINNQEVAPGLYMFTLIDNDTEEKFVGKFAIIR